jgi:hypothetical protein
MSHSSPSALGYKVNRRQAREGPPEEPLGMSHSSPSALGYKVNRRKAREGTLGYSVYRKAVSADLQTHSGCCFVRQLAQTDIQLA